MTARLAFELGAIGAAAVVAWLFTRGYYRAAYGDRYQRGYDDGRAAQIRAYQAARPPVAAWQSPVMLPAPPLPETGRDAYSAAGDVRVLGSWYPEAAGPPRYADLSPEQLDGGPPTSEWARDLIAGIEAWNADYLPQRDLPWAG